MTEYKRIQGKSYMICRAKDIPCGYELQMLKENTIVGLAAMQIENDEQGMSFWYEISGRHDLEGYVNVHKLDGKFLERFLNALQQTTQNIGEYLLEEDGISLEPSHIFMDFEEKKIDFCYLPFAKKSFEDAFRGFMEYFLQHMEHTSQEDIQKCYEIYERCQKENVCLDELIALLYSKESIKENEEFSVPNVGETVEEEIKYTPEKVRKEKRHLFGRKKKKEEPFVYTPEDIEEESVYPTVFLGSEVKEVLGELRYEGNGTQKNMNIQSMEYLIGKEPEEVDGVIVSSTVSRVHAKITKEGENYYLDRKSTRLNSSHMF